MSYAMQESRQSGTTAWHSMCLSRQHNGAVAECGGESVCGDG